MDTSAPPERTQDNHILDGLTSLRSIIFASFQEGGNALASFHASWSSFKNTYDECSSSLLAETRAEVDSFRDVVHSLSSTIFDSDKIQQEYDNDLAEMIGGKLHRLSLSDEPDDSSVVQGPYIQSCYMWLLDNLHNPYPSKEFRNRVAEEVKCDVGDIDAWFISVRKRIGWKRVLKEHFNTRSEMVKFAIRYFKPKARVHRYLVPASVVAEYDPHFAAIQANAQALYSQRFFESTLASNVGSSGHIASEPGNSSQSPPFPAQTNPPDMEEPPVRGNTSSKKRRRTANSEHVVDSMSTSGAAEVRHKRPSKRSRIASSSVADLATASSSSTKVHQDISLPASSLVATTPLDEETTTVSPREKRKRRSLSPDDYDSDSSDVARVRQKRRGDSDSGSEESVPPSPTLQKRLQMGVASTPLPAHQDQTQAPGQSSAAPILRKRKRRLSDTEGNRPKKLPTHPALMVPRLQTVSNPLPASSSLLLDQDPPTTSTFQLRETGDYDMPNFDLEVFNFSSVPSLNDFLAQTDSVPSQSRQTGLTPTMIPSEEHEPSTRPEPSNSPTSFPVFDLELAPNQQHRLSSIDNVLAEIQALAGNATPDAQQGPSSTVPSDISSAFGQPFDSIFNNAPVQSLETSLYNPLLPTSNSFPPVNVPNFMAPDLFTNSSEQVMGFGDVSPVTFALQKIQDLQAQLDMYKSQLAQYQNPV